MQRAVDFLGLRRGIVGMLTMVVLVGMGEHMAERFLPVYLLALGGGAISIGLLAGLDDLLSALYSFPGGYLAARLGTKRSLLAFNLMAIAGFALVAAIPAWPAVIGGAVLFLSWSAISLPAVMGLIAAALPAGKRTMGVSMHSLVRKVPRAAGPLVAGVLIDVWGTVAGVRLAFGGAMVLAAVALILQTLLIEDDRPEPGRSNAHLARIGLHPARWVRSMSPPLRNLLVSDILIRFCERIPDAFVVVWAMQVIASPVDATRFGVLTVIEMATAALVYIPVAHLADRGGKRPFILATFVFFTLFPVVLWFSRSFWMLAAAFVVRGLKEFGEPARKALIMDLAPEDAKAVTFGTYYLVRDVVVSVAAFGGAWLWRIHEVGPTVNLMTALAFGIIGTIWFALNGRDTSVPPGE
ncbi:MAG: MFS transporter [Planctomycetes bacterium]|nr:MFS transporter [Planctomycetota bacterium]